VPPKQYLEQDYILAKSPNRINPKDKDISNIPLAGKLSELGQQILTLGYK
jgi:hypothetical protein